MSLLQKLNVGSNGEPPTILVYGTEGVGKSSFCAFMPKPVFLLTENSLKGDLFKERNTTSFPIATQYDEVMANINMLLVDEHDFKTLVIDSWSSLQTLIFEEVAELKGKDDISDIGFQNGYKKAIAKQETILKSLTKLIQRKKMMIVIVAHCEVTKHNPPDGEAYDKYNVALHKELAPFVKRWVDVALFFQGKVYTSKDKNDKVTAVNNEMQRFIYTQERPLFWAKNRYGLPFEIPFKLNGTAWKTIQDGIFKPVQKEPNSENNNNKEGEK